MPYFPITYIENNDKLFYWYSPQHHISYELISVLSKYNLIDSLNVDGFVGISETSSIIDDFKNGIDYYFCNNNFLKYRKVSTLIAFGWYDPPKLNCE